MDELESDKKNAAGGENDKGVRSDLSRILAWLPGDDPDEIPLTASPCSRVTLAELHRIMVRRTCMCIVWHRERECCLLVLLQ